MPNENHLVGQISHSARRRYTLVRVCGVAGLVRSTGWHQPVLGNDEEALPAAMVGSAGRFGRYRPRRVTAVRRRARQSREGGADVKARRVESPGGISRPAADAHNAYGAFAEHRQQRAEVGGTQIVRTRM